MCAQYFSKGISSVSLEASAHVCAFIFVFILLGLNSNALHSGESCVTGISSSLYTLHSIFPPFHSWTFETAAMTTGHIETAAEAEPSSCHRLAEAPCAERNSDLCHLKRAACATFQYLSILHTPVFSLWVISLSTSASPYDAAPGFMAGNSDSERHSWFLSRRVFFFKLFFTFLNAILQGRLTTTTKKNHCRRSVKFKELCSHGRAGVAMEMSDSLRAFVCVCISVQHITIWENRPNLAC